jgi:hypothetical protein
VTTQIVEGFDWQRSMAKFKEEKTQYSLWLICFIVVGDNKIEITVTIKFSYVIKD